MHWETKYLRKKLSDRFQGFYFSVQYKYSTNYVFGFDKIVVVTDASISEVREYLLKITEGIKVYLYGYIVCVDEIHSAKIDGRLTLAELIEIKHLDYI